MKEEEILDAPADESENQKNKLKWAAISILILIAYNILELFINPFVFPPTVLGCVLSLYFFIKKVKPEALNIQQLFWWSTGIVFSGFLIFSLFEFWLFELNIHLLNIWNFLNMLWVSVVLGFLPAIGVFHFIKNKNWAMLVLMIFISWFSTTMFMY